MKRHVHDVVVCGAGHNGLVAAAYLARAGLDVLVLERRHEVGGACATEEIFPGFHVSTCAYVLHNLRDEVVADLDLRRHGFAVTPLDPAVVHVFPDGGQITAWADPERTVEEIRAFSVADARAYPAWVRFWHDAGGIFHRLELELPPSIDELERRLRGTREGRVLDRLRRTTIAELVDEHFESPHVRAAALARFLDYKAPDEPGVLLTSAAFRSDLHVDPANQGIVRGGMGGLSLALAAAARSLGAHIRVGAEVQRILVDGGTACGVRLVDGQEIRARVVLSNADPQRTLLELAGPGALEPAVADRVRALDTDKASVKFHAALAELPDLRRFLGDAHDPRMLAMIRICPSVEDFFASSDAAARGEIPRSPVMALQIPTVYDETLAPAGRHIASIWARTYPSTPAASAWAEHRDRVASDLVEAVTEYAPNFRDAITDWALYTPVDMERRIGLPAGNIHHTTMADGQLLADRLICRASFGTPIENLYLCGAGSHPGGEVSGAPGYNAAQAVLARR